MGALVLLPGLDGTGLLFADFVEELRRIAPEIDAIVVQYPTDQPLGYAELEKIVREALPKDGPFVLLGESFSGPVAISIAASRPTGLVGLVLVCTFARYSRPFLRHLDWLAPYIPVSGGVISLARKIVAPGEVEPSVRAKLNDARKRVAKRVIRARVGELLRVDATEKIAQIEVPILDLRARKDGIVPNRAGDAIRRLGCRVSVFEVDGPHFILLAKPPESAQAIRNFVQSLAKDASLRAG